MIAAVRTTLLRPVAAALSRLMRTSLAQRHLAPHIARLQLWLYRRTGGRFQLSALLVPSLVLTTIGARSGLRRDTPLMCWPQSDGSFLVAGSNFGGPTHPAWTANALAHPEVELVFRRVRQHAKAQLLGPEEREAVWPVLEAQWPGYRAYERQAGRQLRLFRLIPDHSGEG